ncbi:hypothetical protein HDU67_003205, partial [Dinochytrium kinnereticum]
MDYSSAHEALFSPSPPALDDRLDGDNVGSMAGAQALKRPFTLVDSGGEEDNGAVTDDTEIAFDDLTPEEIEQKDEEVAWILGYLDGDVKLSHLPDHLHETARRRMQRKIRRKRIETKKTPKPDFFSSFKPAVAPSGSFQKAASSPFVDLTASDEDEKKRQTLEKQELDDLEFARKLQEEENRLAMAAAATLKKSMRPVEAKPVVLDEEDR